jgi:hypothetical protein
MATNGKSKQAGHPGSKTFISYRREDAADIAGRMRDWLVQVGRVPQANVFMDVTAILPGQDFMQVIDQAIAQCSAMILVISPSWLAQVTSSPNAYVRLEAEAALRHKLLVIPILAGGARMPATEALPESLRPLKALNARAVRPEDFDYDMQAVGRSLGVKPARRRSAWLVAVSAVALVAVGLGLLIQFSPLQSFLNPPTATATSTPSPSPSPKPNNPYSVSNAGLILDDQLMGPEPYDWGLTAGPSGNCAFGTGGVHCMAVPGNAIQINPQNSGYVHLHNVIFEVKASFAQSYVPDAQFYDKSEFWLAVRAGPNTAYLVRFTPAGDYMLEAIAANNGNVLAQGVASSFQPGNALNTVALVVQDTSLSVYVNFRLVTTVTDEAIGGDGTVVLAVAGPAPTLPSSDVTEVVFTDARVWQLP